MVPAILRSVGAALRRRPDVVHTLPHTPIPVDSAFKTTLKTPWIYPLKSINFALKHTSKTPSWKNIKELSLAYETPKSLQNLVYKTKQRIPYGNSSNSHLNCVRTKQGTSISWNTLVSLNLRTPIKIACRNFSNTPLNSIYKTKLSIHANLNVCETFVNYLAETSNTFLVLNKIKTLIFIVIYKFQNTHTIPINSYYTTKFKSQNLKLSTMAQTILKQKKDWIIIGVSGVTCGGKTTLANRLKDTLTPVHIFHQDKYFYPDDSPKHVKCDGLAHNNYDILSSLDMDKMYKDVLETLSGEDASHQSNKERKAGQIEAKNKKFLIIEGFTVLNFKPLLELCDLR